MKKIASLLLCVAMLCTVLTPAAWAAEEEAQQMQQVLATVKARVDVPAELSEFRYNQVESEAGIYYEFEWQTAERNAYIQVTSSLDGIIVSYHRYDENDGGQEGVRLPQISAEQAAECAKQAVAQLNPQIADNIKITADNRSASLWSDEYRFSLTRVENGVEFPANGGTLVLGGQEPKLQMFSLEWWGGVTFPNPQPAISTEEAQAAYAQNIGLELVYKSTRDYNKKQVIVYPAYVPAKDSDVVIDAITGQAVTKTERIYGVEKGLANSASGGGAARDEFSVEEQRQIDATAGLIGQAAAQTAVETCDLFDIAGFAVTDTRLAEDEFYPGTYRYRFTFQKEEEGKRQYANATVDGKTGEIVSYSKYGYREDDEKAVVLDEQTVTKKAQDAFAQLAGQKASEFQADGVTENTVQFYRMINGIPYLNNSASVTVDGKTGEVTNYSVAYTQDTFPSVEGCLDPAAAAQKLFEQVDYQMIYIPVYPEDSQILPTQTALVYQTNAVINVNPFEGYLMDSKGERTEDIRIPEYTDLGGHYAQDKINALKDAGVYLKGDLFRPDEAILQKDFVALLSMVFEGWGIEVLNDGAALEQAYDSLDIVKPEEKNPDAPVTREQAALFIVRALGIDQYASLPGIYNCPFPDVTNYPGHVSILYAMGVVSGDEAGNYNPTQTLTRADSMILLYNYLTR